MDPKHQQGIHCRFGMRSIIAEAHFDRSRNAIAMMRGLRRWIMTPPGECETMYILPRNHPSGRHSEVSIYRRFFFLSPIVFFFAFHLFPFSCWNVLSWKLASYVGRLVGTWSRNLSRLSEDESAWGHFATWRYSVHSYQLDTLHCKFKCEYPVQHKKWHKRQPKGHVSIKEMWFLGYHILLYLLATSYQ